MSIVTLCGSTRFKCAFNELAKELTLRGNIVLYPCIYEHSGDIITPEQKEILVTLHRRMIDISEEVIIVNVMGYVGDTTLREIEYAKLNNKVINYLEYNNCHQLIL